jgi:hypothetical protein
MGRGERGNLLPFLSLDELNMDDNKYTNHYECPCGTSWDDNWSCSCNDRCPECDKEIQPTYSIDNETGERIDH